MKVLMNWRGAIAASAACLAFAPTAGAAPTYDHDLGRFATAEISPVDVVRDSLGNWVVMDEGLECIKVYSPDLHTVLKTFFTCGVEGNDGTHIRRARGIGIDLRTDALWVADTPNHRLLKVNKWGTVVVSTEVSSAPGGKLSNPGDVAVDDEGNAYVIDQRNRIVKVSGTGVFLKQWGSTGSGPGQMSAPLSIAYSSVGGPTLYVTDARNYRVEKFGLFGFYKGSLGSQGTGNGQFTRDARGVAVDANGAVYAADVGGNRIVRWAADDTPLPSLGGGLPYYRSGPTDLFYGARGLSVAGNTLAVSDMWGYRVLLWSLNGAYLGQIGGPPPPPDGHMDPHGVALDGAGNVYVSDYWHQYIQVFKRDGTFLARWGIGRGTGPGTLNLPGGIETDSTHGYLYIANREQNSIDRWRLSDGRFNARYPVPGSSVTTKGFPHDVAVNTSTGAFYAVDDKNNKMDFFSPTGTVTKTITTYGTTGARMGIPYSVALDPSGNLYVGDFTNKMIHVYEASGDWLRDIPTVVRPTGVDVRDGVLYVLTAQGVREYTLAGTLIISWGSAGTGDNQFNHPYVGIAVDEGGNVYVGDSNSHRVKVFAP
jgi:sugar lactone lactonase YvrE